MNINLISFSTGRSSPAVLEVRLTSKSWSSGTKRRKTSKREALWRAPGRCVMSPLGDVFWGSPWPDSVFRLQPVQKNRGRVHPRCRERAPSEGAAPAAADLLPGPVLPALHQRGTGRRGGEARYWRLMRRKEEFVLHTKCLRRKAGSSE